MTIRTPWTGRHDAALDAFAERVRGELGAMRVPAAGEELLERVLESRRRGQRVILPVQDRAPRRRGVYSLAAIAAAAAALFAIQVATRDLDAVSNGEGWFASDRADAQIRPDAPIHPGVRVTHPERLRPVHLTYRSTVRAADRVTARQIAVSATRTAVAGMPAWAIVSTTTGPAKATERESVWVSAVTFEPLRRSIVRTPYRRYDRIEVQQAFTGQRVRGEMKAYRGGTMAAHRTFDRTLPDAFSPYVTDAFAPLYHTGVKMDAKWVGSLSTLGWAVRDDDVFTSMAMKVEGEEKIRVPVGEFPCWRVAIDLANGQHVVYWVRKSDGLGIRSVDSTDARGRGVREIVLSAERTP